MGKRSYTVLDVRPDGTFVCLADHVTLSEALERVRHARWAGKVLTNP
jgi:hypothetical protein